MVLPVCVNEPWTLDPAVETPRGSDIAPVPENGPAMLAVGDPTAPLPGVIVDPGENDSALYGIDWPDAVNGVAATETPQLVPSLRVFW